MIVSLLLIFSILLILHVFIRYRKFGRIIHQIPGPRAFPIIGNIHSFITPNSKQMWNMFQEWQKQYPIMKLWFGYLAMAVTRDPDHIKVLLSCKKNINKDLTAYNTGKCTGLTGLLLSGGKYWESRRKIINPAFSKNMLEFYSKKIDACSKKLINELLSYGKTTTQHVLPIFDQFTFAISCETILDYNLDGAKKQSAEEFRCAARVISEICYWRVYRPYIQDWMMRFLPIGRSQAKAILTVKKFSENVINERRNYHESCATFKDYLNNVQNYNEDDIKRTKQNLSLLDVLLLNEEKGLIDRHGVLEEVVMIIGVSYESTAKALAFFTIALAENKQVQDVARQELLDVVGGYGNVIKNEHIKKLDYLERCAKESLRLYTTVPIHGRSIDEDVKLGKYTIPVGLEMYINSFQLHRDPNLWPNPLKFDPDRFLPENVQKQHPFAYVPFSKGPRGCIGQKFAMTEIKSAIAHILYNYYLEPVDRSADFEFDLGITLTVEKTRVKFTKI